MVPAAILATGAASIGVDFVQWIAQQVYDFLPDAIWTVWRAAVMGAVFVLAGAAVAPSRHPAVPLGLSSGYAAGVSLLSYALIHSDNWKLDVSTGLGVASTVVAAAAAFGAAAYWIIEIGERSR